MALERITTPQHFLTMTLDVALDVADAVVAVVAEAAAHDNKYGGQAYKNNMKYIVFDIEATCRYVWDKS